MMNNYDRLKLELIALLKDEEVHRNISPTLRLRAQQILHQSTPSPKPSLSTHLFKNTISIQQPLFPNHKPNSHQFQKSQSNLQKKRNVESLDYQQSTPPLFPNSLLKYERINGLNGLNVVPHRKTSSKSLKSDSKVSRSKLKTLTNKSKQNVARDIVRFNTESCVQKKNTTEQVISKKVSISSLVNNKQNYPSKYSSFNLRQKTKMPKKFSKDDTSPFKHINITREPSLNRSRLSHKIFSTQPSIKLNKLAGKDKSKERMSTLKSVMSVQQGVKKLDVSMGMYERIKEKQQGLNIERDSLQQKIKYYRWLIQTQNSKAQNINNNIKGLNQDISSKVVEERLNRQDYKVSRKKSQSEMVERKMIEASLQTTNKSLKIVLDNIEQERYLINMYEKVIEEIKHQLKIEQHQKSNLIKHLMNLKNHEKMIIQKYIYRQALNGQIFNTLHLTIQHIE